MAQLENIEAIEKRLWSAADTLRTNSNFASNEYFLPVMGLIFLRHAYSRYLNVKGEIVANLPSRGGKTRELTKEDFSQKTAIFLQEKAQFDYLVSLPDDADRPKAIIDAMESIEGDYDTLKGVLPKGEYQQLDNPVLGQLLRTLNPEELKQASGDIFGRIYEYFLTGFADLKAHDGGEFFTPVSLVSLIANVIEPENGTVLDPACGSGGMFVQSAHFVELKDASPAEQLTFYGMEKNPTTVRLAKMNLAVHGLEGNVQQAISYYEDPHELVGGADFVMANPPFNADEIDSEKVKNDPRLPFGLPGVNKAKKVSNGNYCWISYFHSYLNDTGRAGFVMSSQASSAGRDEAKVRQKLIETGDVDVMVAIRSNFFYTRTVPCELWFLNRDKPEEHKGKVLMIDARSIYRKVTRKIYDFSPEQQQNILAVVWLYRGEQGRFLELIDQHIDNMFTEGDACFEWEYEDGETCHMLPDAIEAIKALQSAMMPFLEAQEADGPHAETMKQLALTIGTLDKDSKALKDSIENEYKKWSDTPSKPAAVSKGVGRLRALAESSRDLVKEIDLAYKLSCRLIDCAETELGAKDDDAWDRREIVSLRKGADSARHEAVEQLKLIRYYHKHAAWLTERFPDGKLCDVEGLVKLVDHKELKKNDWSLTPGRYVGVAPEEEDEDFDFEEALREIHVELAGLNEEAVELAEKIAKNFEELGV